MAERESREEDVSPDEDSSPESFDSSSGEDNEITQGIVAQVEYYLFDDYIAHSPFLLKHVSRKGEGYISLNLMAGFNRVKYITSGWKIVSKKPRSSVTLEVNAEGTKVRRRAPLPEHAKMAAARIVAILHRPDIIETGTTASVGRSCRPREPSRNSQR